MFDTQNPSGALLNRAEFHDRVLGCWTGKNIGGTLGAPFENKQQIFNVAFYTNELNGSPIPNDDLDLQLIWLLAVEENGIYHVDERVLGEYWLSHVVGPWEEYGICRNNMTNGFYPPLSGLCGNEVWHNGNGAWIRSEIWACLFPGSPDDAVQYAWYDACVDHAGDGIYAEVFTTALESAAFVEHDLRKLLDIALARIPEDCRIARSVRLAISEFEAGHDFITARNAVVRDSEDIGWFHAPANVAFAIIGLLYGEGDFGKTICTAVNCGDDADCTGATAGAVMGILLGRSRLPQKWVEPIGEEVKTVAVNPFRASLPTTLNELTDRVVSAMELAAAENPTLAELTDGPGEVPAAFRETLQHSASGLKRLLSRNSRTLYFHLPWGNVAVEYQCSPLMEPGSTQKMKVWVFSNCQECDSFYFDWKLPENWSTVPACASQSVMVKWGYRQPQEFSITMPETAGMLTYIPVTVRHSGRNCPEVIQVPFGVAGTISTCQIAIPDQSFWDGRNRRDGRINKAAASRKIHEAK